MGGSWSVLLLVEMKVPDVKYLGPRESPHLVRMAQFMFATVPHHPFWRAVLDLSLSRCRQLLDEGIEWSDGDVLFATGPDVVTSVFHERLGSVPGGRAAGAGCQIPRLPAREFVRH